MRKVALFTMIFGALFARENPFKPNEFNKDNSITSNLYQNAPEFKKIGIKFPSDARELSHVVFFYKSIDGTINQKRVDINGSFDWHDEMVLSIKSETMSQNLDAPATALPKFEAQPSLKPEIIVQQKRPMKSQKFGDFVQFDAYTMTLNIITKDTKIREFLINKPTKIVLDFKAKTKPFKTKTFDVKNGAFEKIYVGYHNDFYRVVILLDGNYLYNVKERDFGYSISVK